MKISYVDHNKKLYNDKFFISNRDDITYPIQFLRFELDKLEYEIHTVDIIPIEQANIILYAKISKILLLLKNIKKPYVILSKGKKVAIIKYKFAICYENCGDMPGYITEKIFDCFIARCVPIYGAGEGCKNNIYKYVPKECFIDISNFKNYEEMYSYITNISDEEYYEVSKCC